jgi:hypothetical protein
LVVVASVAIAAIARISALGIGADEFTANTVFWVVAGLGISVYCLLTLFIQGFLDIVRNFFFPKKEQEQIEVEESTAEPEPKSMDVGAIRVEKQQEKDKDSEDKLAVAIRYTQKTFVLYISDEDIKRLCEYMELYSQKIDITNIVPVRVKDLRPIDLYHYGWNIWKHFNITDKMKISGFIGEVFSNNLGGTGVHSIYSHLKDSGPCTIKIKESL